jgi:transposase-like protein
MGTERRVSRDWAAVVAAQATSGEGVKAFCRRQGIGANLFYRWRVRLGAQRASAGAPPAFVELRPAAGLACSGVTVVVARGWRIELAPGFDAATLSRALACVQTPVPCSG